MEPWVYEDEIGDKLTVSEAQGGVFVDASRVFVPSLELVDLCVAMYQQAGQPVPVITPRPDIDTSRPLELGPFQVAVNGRKVWVRVGAGEEFRAESVPPSIARQLAGWLVAYADAAGTEPAGEPDPAEVDALAVLFEASPTVMGLDGARPGARRILAALPGLGYTREARDA